MLLTTEPAALALAGYIINLRNYVNKLLYVEHLNKAIASDEQSPRLEYCNRVPNVKTTGRRRRRRAGPNAGAPRARRAVPCPLYTKRYDLLIKFGGRQFKVSIMPISGRDFFQFMTGIALQLFCYRKYFEIASAVDTRPSSSAAPLASIRISVTYIFAVFCFLTSQHSAP
ncbi:hypothetical protein EVAR_325_1 [Eumeta japonica]|uniref:Uncharacterized protein n=1 Tax=Eumeta variegata TaxID=151549 RepID=A0A4C1S9L5_EUMVA|nr:hypothetical protein EVAR_325_1 [Eumeta japonica]